MSDQYIVIERVDDEQVDLFVMRDDERHDISSVNHDDHGWGGMQAVEDAVREVAQALDIKVVDW